MSFRILKRRIFSDALEVEVADQCNLACRACSHLSPVAPNKILDVSELERDLSVLATCLHASLFRLVGGEPLLHPQLSEVARVVRASGIADKIVLLTNGLLLNRAPGQLWDTLDRVEIYVYPGREARQSDLERLRRASASRKLEVAVKRIQVFRESYSELPFEDTKLVQRIYNTCRMSYAVGCCAVHHGYFYRCAQAHAIPARAGKPPVWKAEADGVKLDNPDTLFERLSAYLANPSPLLACRHCLGTAGKLFRHEQVPRAEWRNRQRVGPQELIDRGALFCEEHMGRVGIFFHRLVDPSTDPTIQLQAETYRSWGAMIRFSRKVWLVKGVPVRLFYAMRTVCRVAVRLFSRVVALRSSASVRKAQQV